MFKRKQILLVIVIIIFSTSYPGAAGYGNMETSPPLLSVVQSSGSGIELDLNVRDYEITPIKIEGNYYQQISVKDSYYTSKPGEPQLPKITAMIGIPADAKPEIVIKNDDVVTLPDFYSILPVSKNDQILDDSEQRNNQYEAKQEIYLSGTEFPRNSVRLTNDAWIRNQRIITLEFFPFQYNPISGKLTWHKSMQVFVRFNEGNTNNLQSTLEQVQDNGFDAVLKNSLVNYESAKEYRGYPDDIVWQNNIASTELMGQNEQIKITVDQNGIYKITYAGLKSAGVDVDNLDATTFLMINQGRNVSIQIVDNDGSDENFSTGEYILFYGEKFEGTNLAQQYSGENTHWWKYYEQQFSDGTTNGTWAPEFSAIMMEKYTDDNVYWLSFGGDQGVRMTEVDGFPSDVFSTPDYFTKTVHAENSSEWYTHNFTSEDTWYWENVTDSVTHTYTTTLKHPYTGVFNAVLRGEIAARKSNDYDEGPDHHTKFWFNNIENPIDDTLWYGKSRYGFEVDISQSDLIDGENQLRMKVLMDAYENQYTDRIYFDWFEIDYARTFTAHNDRINFSYEESGGPWEYHISNFTSNDVVALNITDTVSPTVITNPRFAAGTLEFDGGSSGSTEYYIAGKDSLMNPKSIEIYNPPDLSANVQAEYILITHNDFLAATQNLADYRSSKGMSTLVVDIADLYNQFNYGIYHPIAVKKFLAYTFANWQIVPEYVLLVGDGHWNFKGYPGYDSAPIYIPPNLSWVDPWQGEVDSANLLATLVGDDRLPDLTIARLPVNSSAEITAVTEKISKYEGTPRQEWQRRFLFIADNADSAGNFESVADYVIDNYIEEGFFADKVYLSDTLPNTTYALTSTLNITGTLIANYSGHASIEGWANERIFTVDDIDTLSNGEKLPVVLSLDCLDGYWIYPGQQSLIEEMVRADNKGALAAFSPTGLGVSTGHDYLQRGFYEAILRNGEWKFGQIVQSAKLKLYGANKSLDLINTYTIFGDPAIVLPSPYGFQSEPPSASHSVPLGGSGTYAFTITNTSSISDTYTLSVGGYTWPVSVQDPTNLIPPSTQGNAEVTVSVPWGTSVGASDALTLTITSVGDQSLYSSVQLATIADLAKLLLPIIYK